MWGTGRARISIPISKNKDSGMRKGKNKKWAELLKDITTMIMFYIFIYEIKTKLLITNHFDATIFRFADLESREFLCILRDELERLFDKDVITGSFIDGDLFMRIHSDSKKIDFVN